MGRVRSFDALRAVADLAVDEGQLRARYRAQAIDLARAEGLGRAAFVHRIVTLDAPAAAVLTVGGTTLTAPRLLPESGELTALAFGAASLGRAIGERVSALFAERRPSLALALDTLGNLMLIEASRRLQDSVLAAVERAGLTMAGELRPGDPGLALEAQPTVLRLANAAALGVSVTGSLALDPAKSTTVVYGVGRDLPAVSWSRCDDCRTAPKCRMRRGVAAARAGVTGGGPSDRRTGAVNPPGDADAPSTRSRHPRPQRSGGEGDPAAVPRRVERSPGPLPSLRSPGTTAEGVATGEREGAAARVAPAEPTTTDFAISDVSGASTEVGGGERHVAGVAAGGRR